MTEPENHPKRIVSISDRGRIARYLRAVSLGCEGVASHWKSNTSDETKQPVTAALVAAYIKRLEIQSLASGGGLESLIAANEKYPSTSAEIRELSDWIIPIEPPHLNPKVTEDNEDKFGDALVAARGRCHYAALRRVTRVRQLVLSEGESRKVNA